MRAFILKYRMRVIIMINLSLNDIRKTTNDLSFKRGVIYYQNGLVNNMHHRGNELVAIVSGSEEYEIIIGFDSYSGKLGHMMCNCSSFTNYSGACKHIVATLLQILYSKEKINMSFDRLSNEKIIHAFSNTLMEGLATRPKEQVHLDVILEPVKEGLISTSLRLGTDKMYVVKDYTQLIKSLNNNEPIIFGKNLSFDPLVHYFNDRDQQIIDLILDFFDTYTFFRSYPYDSRNAPSNNSFHLPDSQLKRLLALLKNEAFSLKYHGMTHSSVITNGPLPIDFKVTDDGTHIVVDFKEDYNFFNITKDHEYVFFEGDIFHLTPKERRYFSVIHSHFDNQKEKLILSSEFKTNFLTVILPVLRTFGKVHLDEQMMSNLILEDFSAHIYLDRFKNTVKGTVAFVYGDYKVGIYPEVEPLLPEGVILVRNIEKESQILTTLENAHCTVEPSQQFLILPDEDQLYDFVETHLPKLQALANLYYSEDFKSLQIRVPQNVQSAIRLNENSNMLEFSFNIDTIDKKELPHILKSIQEKKKYYRLKDGSFLQLDQQELLDVSTVIEQLHLKTKDFSKDVIELPKYRALFIDTLLAEKNLSSFTTHDGFKKLVQDIKNPAELNYEAPASLATILRNYQTLGFKWLKALSYYGFGGILADDMGLGKTLQAITLLKSIDANKKSLVVTPTSLVYNWADEFNKFAPDLKICVISGDKKIRSQAFENLNEYQVIITSYGLLKRDLDEYLAYQFEYCFIDEAQHIKNPNSLNAKSVKTIKASHRFALTGTPIENSLTELWSIFDFVMPGYLYSHTKFINTYERPIIKNQDQEALKQLTKQIKPFLLRRLKSDVLKELPPKIETKMTTELFEEQKKLYLAYLEKVNSEIKSEISSKGFPKSSMVILAALTRLRQICCHPALFAENYKDKSAKLELLEEIVIDAIESGHRILIFSQFTSMLKMIKVMLERNKVTHFYLDGATKAEVRRDMVHHFNEGENNVFLISLKAGGTGLNLTGADMVIHYDPWWNPATEDQATDRAYRIGQDKPVQVIRLITAGTIEEKIYKLQQKKKSLIDSVIEPGETLISKLTEAEIMGLLET